MDFFNPLDTSRFANLNILTTTYKTVNDHEITTDVLYPKSLTSSTPRPVLLRYHGGGFFSGSSLFPGFFNPWYIELAERYGSFLEEKTSGTLKADLDRILTGGDSAGGYLSIQIALNHPDKIRAVTAAYPSLDLKAPHYTGQFEKVIFNMPSSPRNLVDDYMNKVKAIEAETGKKVVVSADPRLERATLMFSPFQHGLLSQFLPDNPRVFPLDRLDRGERFPRGGIVILHGLGDTVVPIEGSYKLKGKLEELDPELDVKLVVREGEHGFDGATRDEEWLWNGVKDCVAAWLK
ncbi:hypothetical protein MW887_004764 [Aspergillus wentii]|nr:hypothetical protein MW887_004764 [Aspergillus wentii]